MTDSTATVTFPLRRDFHDEIGWTDFIRQQSTQNADAIRAVLEFRARYRLPLGKNPLGVFEKYEPLSPFMLYFWIWRAGKSAPALAVSDGLFNMTFEPPPDGSILKGMAWDLHEAARAAVACAAIGPSPFLPRTQPKASFATYGDLLIVHRFEDSRAECRASREVLPLVRDNLQNWARLEWERHAQQSPS